MLPRTLNARRTRASYPTYGVSSLYGREFIGTAVNTPPSRFPRQVLPYIACYEFSDLLARRRIQMLEVPYALELRNGDLGEMCLLPTMLVVDDEWRHRMYYGMIEIMEALREMFGRYE